MQASCNSSTVVYKVSTGPCHQQNFGHDSRGYTMMIKSNFTLLNIICVHTNHVCSSWFIHIYNPDSIKCPLTDIKSCSINEIWTPFAPTQTFYCYSKLALVIHF